MDFGQIYTDITSKVIPSLAQGITLTKDYFMDVSSRYIKYLIIIDSVTIVLNIISIILLLSLGYYCAKFFLKRINENKVGDNDGYYGGIVCVYSVLIPLLFICVDNTIACTNNLILTYTVPEVRIYNELKSSSIGDKLP